jgi:signal transduction histidine kinase
MFSAATNETEIRKAYAEYDREQTIANFKVACVLGMLLMPAGMVLDYAVYGPLFPDFAKLRFLCSLLIGLFLGILLTPLGNRYYRFLGVTLFALPASFIAFMIYYSYEGAGSPYYAGLYLVLLVLAFVLHWTFRESLAAAVLVLLLYFAACGFHIKFPPQGSPEVMQARREYYQRQPKDKQVAERAALGLFVNNLYFLGLTGIIVVTGSYFHSKARYNEFRLRYQLDKSSKALEESNQKLVELDKVKSGLFANISHELRTPLTLLLAPLERLIHQEHLNGETKDLLVTMHSNGMRLLKLINDLLDLVRLESGRMEVRSDPLDVTEFIKGLASAVRQVAEDKRLRFSTEVDPKLGTVLADRDKLDKIVLNLVFNAIKFTPAGGRLDLRVEKVGEWMILEVADSGMGIPEKSLPYVFDRFWQADGSAKRKYQGVGIGLALVKEFVEIQGGHVRVTSQEGKGTTFTVTMPFRPVAGVVPRESAPAAGHSAGSNGSVTSEEWLSNLYRRAELFPAMTPLKDALKPVETSRNGQQPQVLVADDEPDMLRFIRSQLQSSYHLLEAVDGQQAVEKAGQFLPDLILLDMMMPEKDGLQACREIRERTSTQSIPIILLTARADEETKLAALKAGASDFLAKPFSVTELHVRIKNLIESYAYQRKLSRQNDVLKSTIDQLKETETQLVQSEKLASLGVLSAGIIHEINNPLNFANMGLQILRKKTAAIASEHVAEYEETLQDMEGGLRRVRDIVADLRMFSHADIQSREHVEVSSVAATALRLLSSEWKDKVRVEMDVPPDQTAWANKNLLIQVLINLLQNAIDSLEKKTFHDEQPTVWIEGSSEAGKSVLRIRDNGTGIEHQHLDKIFDPFYTTKEVGDGMGLGLSIVYRIVEKFDGQINVRTEPGRFCEFILEFPEKGPPARTA